MSQGSRHDAPPEPFRSAWRANGRRALAPRGGGRTLLRPLEPGDADAMAGFFAALSEREIYYFFILDDAAARRLAECASDDPAMRLVALEAAEDGERIVGYMFLDWSEGTPPTFGACLTEQAQSQGLGRTMMEHLLSLAAEARTDQVRLTAHAENWRALRLYQRLGFRITDEFILERQGAKQYRMLADLSSPPPVLLDDPALVARGGLGIGLAAVRIQATLESFLGARLLIADRPAREGVSAIVVADLAAAPEHPFQAPEPPFLRSAPGPGWIKTLDPRTTLIGGFGPSAVSRAADRYLEVISARYASLEARMRDDHSWLLADLSVEC